MVAYLLLSDLHVRHVRRVYSTYDNNLIILGRHAAECFHWTHSSCDFPITFQHSSTRNFTNDIKINMLSDLLPIYLTPNYEVVGKLG